MPESCRSTSATVEGEGASTDTKGAPPLLTRHEVARVLGLRSLELSGGAVPQVDVDGTLHADTLYVAALEMSEHVLDALIQRPGEMVDVRVARYPPSLYVLLDTIDGERRSYMTTTAARASRSVTTSQPTAPLHAALVSRIAAT